MELVGNRVSDFLQLRLINNRHYQSGTRTQCFFRYVFARQPTSLNIDQLRNVDGAIRFWD
jgi:hypothetical protein